MPMMGGEQPPGQTGPQQMHPLMQLLMAFLGPGMGQGGANQGHGGVPYPHDHTRPLPGPPNGTTPYPPGHIQHMPGGGPPQGGGPGMMHPGNAMQNSFNQSMTPVRGMPSPNQAQAGGFGQMGAIGGSPYGMYGSMYSGVGPSTDKSMISGPKM
jgi:hypothetical protein